MKPTTTRTLNPLPFEHLEPKRFEDLSRQLVYDFRTWRQLEATGRAGSDDGFDARGFEIVPTPDNRQNLEEEDSIDETATDRLWLIQCKREGVIGPAKMQKHLADIPAESRVGLYGLIFVAACNPSKGTRDVLRNWCAEHGIAECHLWGRAEIEDMLFQPRNDNLLFAYFGISLQIRRNSIATNIRRDRALKRKLRGLMEKSDQRGLTIIFRDPSDNRYPFTAGKNLKEGNFLWRVMRLHGLGIYGVKVLYREHFAYYDSTTGQWDVATGHNLAGPAHNEDFWPDRRSDEETAKVENAGRHFWLSIPGSPNHHAKFILELHYEDIIEIDEVGNDDIKLATIFVAFRNGRVPLHMHRDPVITSGRSWDNDIRINKKIPHVRVFPDEARDAEFDALWQKNEGIRFALERTELELTPPEWLVGLQRGEAEARKALDKLAQLESGTGAHSEQCD